MVNRKIWGLIGLFALTGCADTSISSANITRAANTGLAMQLSPGTVISVRSVTIQGDTGNNVAGTVGGAVLGGFAGNTIGGGSGRRLATVGGAMTGAAAGQAIQSGLARHSGVELIIRPDSGNEFVVVQRLDEAQFFVGQRVNITSLGGNITISPMLTMR